MSEAQIETAAKAQGYTAADIAKMRERLGKVSTSPANANSVDKSSERITNGKEELSSKEEEEDETEEPKSKKAKDLKKKEKIEGEYFTEKQQKRSFLVKIYSIIKSFPSSPT